MTGKSILCGCGDGEHVACRGCRILAFGEHGRELGAEGYCSWCIGRRAAEGEMTKAGRERLRRFRGHGNQGERSRHEAWQDGLMEEIRVVRQLVKEQEVLYG